MGLLWSPSDGWNANLVANRVGARYLDKRNTVSAGSYTTIDAGIGYRRDRWELRLDGSNLGNRRDPVSESELGEGQYYRLAARSYVLSLRYSFGKERSPDAALRSRIGRHCCKIQKKTLRHEDGGGF